jgi:hypothetical protein
MEPCPSLAPSWFDVVELFSTLREAWFFFFGYNRTFLSIKRSMVVTKNKSQALTWLQVFSNFFLKSNSTLKNHKLNGTKLELSPPIHRRGQASFGTKRSLAKKI